MSRLKLKIMIQQFNRNPNTRNWEKGKNGYDRYSFCKTDGMQNHGMPQMQIIYYEFLQKTRRENKKIYFRRNYITKLALRTK